MYNEVWKKTLNSLTVCIKEPPSIIASTLLLQAQKKTAGFPTVFWLELLTEPYFRSKRSRFITLVHALEKS
jgi:hypothetical protein